MSAIPPANLRQAQANMAEEAASSLDVSWLLHSKKEPTQPSTTGRSAATSENRTSAQAQPEATPPHTLSSAANQPSATETTPSKDPTTPAPGLRETPTNDAQQTPLPSTPTPVQPVQHQVARPQPARGNNNDENRAPAGGKGPISSLKNDKGRRSSWISNISSKFSTTPQPQQQRSSSVDAQATVQPGPASPKVEFGNPFDKKGSKKEAKKEEPVTVVTHHAPRRQSVLVHAGQERKVDHPGFLQNALRRLSSSNSATLGKGTGSGVAGQRRTLNIDQNRERVKIAEFDQNKLKRVAFCVDVEIAGYGAQAEEEGAPGADADVKPAMSKQSFAGLEGQGQASKKDPQSAKYKDMGEGAALRNPQAASEEKEELGATVADTKGEGFQAQAEQVQDTSAPAEAGVSDPQNIPSTKKKEKKKRSEAERKERKEKKRRQAEANGLVPLELSRNEDDESDSSPGSTPPGATTPNRKSSESPTTDPLRIYKRCCQLRETTVMDRVVEQISKPSATLAEASGTVAVVDLSGTQMTLPDVDTLGDWLAVVPVRKLILDDCGLSDEAVRILLSGLCGCKSAEQAKMNRKLPKRGSGQRGREQMGVIEKLSLKNNSQITSLGWKHVALFMHVSRSLRAIDLSGIPFPRRSPDYNGGELSRTSTASSGRTNLSPPGPKYGDVGTLVAKAIAERFGDKLDELILSRCSLVASHVAELVDSAIKCRIRRLGLADNGLTLDGLEHVVRYVRSGVCEGLDLGGNDLHDSGHLIANSLDADNRLFAISLSDCHLTPVDLSAILPPFANLKNFKFIDLSRNHDLFRGEKNAVSVFRKFLPRLSHLRRIHLVDVGLTSEHVIALSEILPDCPALAHVSVLENPSLVANMNSKEGAAQEEACAFLASLMTAVRVSHTLVAIEIEVPNSESSEVVKALASQIVAYSLRNMERCALGEVGITPHTVPDKDAPEVLLHLVGHMDGYAENHDHDEPAPDEDYVIASTGIVKALGVCLGSQDGHSRTPSRNISPSNSGTATPRQSGPLRPATQKKPKNVTLELCESARKIRMRLRPALVKEDRAGNYENYRRLLFLDSTLERMIQRFEDEYPETKVPPPSPLPSADVNGTSSLSSSVADASVVSAPTDAMGLSKVASSEATAEGDEGNEPYAVKLSRSPSNTSLAAKALTHEEGRMHRFGQTFRREVLKPTQIDDYEHGTSVDDGPEPQHLAALRARLEGLRGDEIREAINREGPENVIKSLNISADELLALEQEDPAGFAASREAQENAQLASPMLSSATTI